MGASLLRLRSDEQLVALFRAGSDDAFRAIHDRYRQRLFAYARQMLPGRQDAEDALQDVFVRAYAGLRANDREVALRAWLYRVAHNRCVDELRRPLVSPAEVFDLISARDQDPVAQADQRESLRRLIADVRRLPQQQRSALLMRELSGMSYAELAAALDTTVPAVKSLLVRARMALALAVEARETSCIEIREELVLAHDRRVRPGAMAKRHLRDCAGCRDFRRDIRSVSRDLAALVPALGPVGVAAKLLGFGFGGSAGGSAAMGGGTAFAGGSAAVGSGGMLASAGALATGAGHVATLIVATVVTAGGAVEIQQSIAPARTPAPAHHHRQGHHAAARLAAPMLAAGNPIVVPAAVASLSAPSAAASAVEPATSSAPTVAATPAKPAVRHAVKKVKPAKAATSTATSKSSAPGTSSSTTSTGTGKPVVESTSVTGTDTAPSGANGSSTSTGTASSQPSASESSAAPGTGTPSAPAAQSGSSSTGSSSGSGTGSGSGQPGTVPTSS